MKSCYVSCVRSCALEKCFQCGGVFLESVSCCCSCCCSCAPLVTRQCPVLFSSLLILSFLHFFILDHFSVFHVIHFHVVSFFRCFALGSRSLGFGLHSPYLLISHLAGLIGVYMRLIWENEFWTEKKERTGESVAPQVEIGASDLPKCRRCTRQRVLEAGEEPVLEFQEVETAVRSSEIQFDRGHRVPIIQKVQKTVRFPVSAGDHQVPMIQKVQKREELCGSEKRQVFVIQTVQKNARSLRVKMFPSFKLDQKENMKKNERVSATEQSIKMSPFSKLVHNEKSAEKGSSGS